MSSKRLCKVSVLCKNSSAWEINFGTSTCRANNDQLFSNAKHPSCLLAGLEFFSCQMKLFSSLRRDDWLVHQPTISWSGSGLPTVFYSITVQTFCHLGLKSKRTNLSWGPGDCFLETFWAFVETWLGSAVVPTLHWVNFDFLYLFGACSVTFLAFLAISTF